MAGERTLPGGTGVVGFWTPGSDGWNTGMDANMRILAALVQCSVLSRSTVLPGSPSDGAIYIVIPADITNPNKIAVRDNGAWVYFAPTAGFRAWVQDTKEWAFFDGTNWGSYRHEIAQAEPPTPPAGSVYQWLQAAGSGDGTDGKWMIKFNVSGTGVKQVMVSPT